MFSCILTTFSVRRDFYDDLEAREFFEELEARGSGSSKGGAGKDIKHASHGGKKNK